jgi:hypothetical protein
VDRFIGADAELVDEVVAEGSAEGDLGVSDAESSLGVGGDAGDLVPGGDTDAEEAVLTGELGAILGEAESVSAAVDAEYDGAGFELAEVGQAGQ